MQISADSEYSRLLKPLSLDQYWGPRGDSKFNIEIYKKHCLINLHFKKYIATVKENTIKSF